MVLVTVNEPGQGGIGVGDGGLGVLPCPTVTVWGLPSVSTVTVLVLPFAVSVTTQLEFAAIPLQVCEYVPAAVPGEMVHSPKKRAIADRFNGDRSLAAGGRAGDHLVNGERAGQVAVRVNDVRSDRAPRQDGMVLATPADRDAHGARAAVNRLGDRTNRSGRDVVVGRATGCQSPPHRW